MEAAEVQREMMQMRLDREIEKSKSVLYKTRGVAGLHMDDADSVGMNGRSKGSVVNGGYKGGKSKVPDEDDRKRIEQQLSPEQLQLFAQENSDMLKHYEDTLDQVRYVFSLWSYSSHLKILICAQNGRTLDG